MKYLIFLVILLVACQPSASLDESICIDQCLRVKGTVTNSLTNEPYENLPIIVEYHGSIFSNFGIYRKAEVKTDANGFYAANVEVFDEEFKNGAYRVYIKENNKVYGRGGDISILSRFSNQVNINDTYELDLKLHRPAYIKYDLDGLSKLKEGETIVFFLLYDIETINGTSKVSDLTRFYFGREEDRGKFKVAAGVPVEINVTFRDSIGNKKILREELLSPLEYNEEYEVEIGI